MWHTEKAGKPLNAAKRSSIFSVEFVHIHASVLSCWVDFCQCPLWYWQFVLLWPQKMAVAEQSCHCVVTVVPKWLVADAVLCLDHTDSGNAVCSSLPGWQKSAWLKCCASKATRTISSKMSDLYSNSATTQNYVRFCLLIFTLRPSLPSNNLFTYKP